MNRLVDLPERVARCWEGRGERLLENSVCLECCTRLVAAEIGCGRAGVWQFVEAAEGGRALKCLALYDAESDAMVNVPDSHAVGAYFLAIEQTGYINAADASSHFATSDLFADRLSARRIRSLLAASLSFGGQVRGAFTCTEVDRQVEWSPGQVGVLRQVAARVAQALFGDSTRAGGASG